jgi:hypothetical protein
VARWFLFGLRISGFWLDYRSSSPPAFEQPIYAQCQCLKNGINGTASPDFLSAPNTKQPQRAHLSPAKVRCSLKPHADNPFFDWPGSDTPCARLFTGGMRMAKI